MSSTINSEEERNQRSSSFTTQPPQYTAPSSLHPGDILVSQQLQRELDIYAERHAPQQRLQNVNNENEDEDEDEVMVDIDDETMAAEVALNAYDRIIEIADMVVGGSSAPDIDGQEASTADGAGDDDGDDNGNNDDNDGVQVGSPPSPLLLPPSLSPAPSEATTALLPPTPQSTASRTHYLPYRPQPQPQPENPQGGVQGSDQAENASSSSSDFLTVDDPDADGDDGNGTGTLGHGSGSSSKKGRRARDEKGRFVRRGCE